ncbi:acyl-CoA thioesterase [Stenotrophomonas ginsengisoli]|uniref:Acyl-CoA thioesterase n=1 Tax=Stenotrophomonas ginsengisoli TaxID=336566 RepID=A0A0R0DMT9_9GAMM|nr:tol-pal system-associated acyl-CoA thioesterase [Stenotrophomonas ginsengisoli]KRG79396.1 acyl-CoA thioesterase [Stenotrophomonas ginsengisoli]
MSIEQPFIWPTRVYWEDTDAGGVVYHARYVAFMERARTEWMRALGWGQEAMRTGGGQVFVVRAMSLDFHKPARLDDALTVSVELTQCRRASLVMAQQVRRDGQLLASATVRLAAVGAEDFRPQPIDAHMLSVFEPLQVQHESLRNKG